MILGRGTEAALGLIGSALGLHAGNWTAVFQLGLDPCLENSALSRAPFDGGSTLFLEVKLPPYPPNNL